jgi:glycine/serine hydroxymethyltransferase
MKEGEMRLIARLIGDVLLRQVPPARVRAQVEELCASFPLYPELWPQ